VLLLGFVLASVMLPLTWNGGNVFAEVDIDWPAFLGRNEMVWKTLPNSWNNGPFTGNGRLGTIFWLDDKEALHFEISRGDLYDNRRMQGFGTLFARCRLPNGHFKLAFTGGNPIGGMRLDLWNAEVTGHFSAGTNEWTFRSFTHATEDVIMVELSGEGPVPGLKWHPGEAKSPRTTGGPPAGLTPYPSQSQREVDSVHVSVQEMPAAAEYHTDGQGSGQYATAWTSVSEPGRTVYFISTRITNPGTAAAEEAVGLVRKAEKTGLAKLEATHRAWWHAYYPKSFLSVPDPAIESFYWIQMYKMVSASRQGGPIMDLMGPWYMRTNWPAIWWNLNIQLQYWPFYMSNHLEEAEPLLDTLWRNREALASNAAPYSADSYAIGRATGPDCITSVGNEVGNLPWTMHNLWMHYRSCMDDALLRDRIFPLMKGSFMYLRHILKEKEGGALVLPLTASPEYTDSVESCTYTLACLRWLATTLIEADQRLKTNDPVVAECRDVLARLEPYPIDPVTGLMVGKSMPFTNSHRHWSHLFPIYPFFEYTWEQPERVELIEKSLTNWTGKTSAFAGYSWLGAASMHAAAGRGDQALTFLHSFLKRSPLPNTLYREGNPVIETPLQFARALQEMLLTSHAGLIRVFPGVPSEWKDVVFADLRTEGAFLVSARREAGMVKWVRIESLAGEPCRIRTGLEGPVKASGLGVKISDAGSGIVEVTLSKGKTVVLYTGDKVPPIDLQPAVMNGAAGSWGGQKP
jgi:alpha-L-fucosidase 2